MHKVYDSLHGFIRLNGIENALVDTPVFQRLRYIRQLGTSYLVYPGATHTRLEHSLGVMELATRMYDQVTAKSTLQKSEDHDYYRQVIRLSALCHDLGHLPLSHVAEKALLGKKGHEQYTVKAIQSEQMEPIWGKVEEKYPGRHVQEDVIKFSIGEEHCRDYPFTPWEKALSQLISGDFFGADRIDYLLRDAKCTGVTYGFFDYEQLIETLCILPSLHHDQKSLELGVEENGIESCEALLLARHFMYKRVYQVPSVKAYSFHMSRFLTTYLSNLLDLSNLEQYFSFTDNEILTAVYKVAKDVSHPAYLDAVCFIDRKKRFRARELPAGITEERLQELKEDLKIPSELISYTLSKEGDKTSRLSFPVLTARGDIAAVKDYSQIVIPSKKSSWVYIAPEFVERFFTKLL